MSKTGSCECFQAKAPGSLVFMGEHAVLHQFRAIGVAIDQWITVNLSPRSDNMIKLESQLGNLELTLEALGTIRSSEHPPFEFVLACLQSRLQNINTGFEVKILSEFSDKMGLGSSGAVIVATLKVLNKWLTTENEHVDTLFKDAKHILLQVQRQGSGIDVATSIYGGMIVYQQNPLIIQSLNVSIPLFAVYSGSKLKTAKVIEQVSAQQRHDPSTYLKLYELMEYCVEKALKILADLKSVNTGGIAAGQLYEHNLSSLGKLMNIHHGLLAALGVSNANLEKIIYCLQSELGVWGAKISGAGLGDSIIALGEMEASLLSKIEALNIEGACVLPLAIAHRGVH